DVGRDDADLVLRDLGYQREHRTNRVRRLGGHPHRQLAADAIHTRYAAARLDRRDMDARNVDVLGNHHITGVECALGRLLVADLPVPDVVGLVVLVRTYQRRVRLKRLDRIEDRRQRFVLDLHGRGTVSRGIAILGQHARDFLRLVAHAVGRQHHLRVAHQRWHPVQTGRFELLAGNHGDDAGYLQRFAAVDTQDAGARVRTAHDIHEQHARQLDIVNVFPEPAQKTWVFLALDTVADASERRRCVRHALPPGCSHPRPRASWRLRTEWL